MGTTELYSDTNPATPLRTLETRLVQKEKSDDQLQTCSVASSDILVIPRARRLIAPQAPSQTFSPIDERTDLNACIHEEFDEKLTRHYLEQYKKPELSEQSLRPGWLYLFKDGALWKEYKVTNDLTSYIFASAAEAENTEVDTDHLITFSEIDVIDPTTIAEGDKSADIREPGVNRAPYLLLPKDTEIQIAWSEVQWGQSRIQELSDASLREKRCTTFSLASAQACSDGSQYVYSSESYQLYAEPTLPQWLCKQVPEQFGSVCTMQPVQHAVTIVLEDHLEIGRELANRYQRAVASHNNLIDELRNANNSGSYPSGEPLKYPYRFARWFDSALFSYQQFFSADNTSTHGENNPHYFSKTHHLHGFRALLDINDIYVALGMEARRLVRSYTEQCQWQLINFIRGHYDASTLVESTNTLNITTIQHHLADYRSLPAVADVMLDADGNPFIPVETDDLHYIAGLLHRIGEVARMKDITIDGNKEAFIAEKKAAENHPCVSLLFEINGDTPSNPWYQYILNRASTDVNGEEEDNIAENPAFQTSRRFGHLLTQIMSNFLGPHLSADRERLLSTKDRLIELLSGKLGFPLTVDKISNLDGSGWDKANGENATQTQKYLLSHVVRPDMIDYPEVEDTSEIKAHRKSQKDKELRRIKESRQRIEPKYMAMLDAEKSEAEAAAKKIANDRKLKSISTVNSSQQGVTQQQAARNRLDMYHDRDMKRKATIKESQTLALTNAEEKLKAAEKQIDTLKSAISPLESDVKSLDMKVADITNQYADAILSADDKLQSRIKWQARKHSVEALLGFPLPFENSLNKGIASAKKDKNALTLQRYNEISAVNKQRDTITQTIEKHKIDLDIAKSQHQHQVFIRNKKQAALDKTNNDIGNSKQRYKLLVEAHEVEAERLKKLVIDAKAQHKTLSKAAQQSLDHTHRQINIVDKEKRKRFKASFDRAIDKVEARYKATLTEIDKQADIQHQKAVDQLKASGNRVSDGNNTSLKQRLREIKAGRFGVKQVETTTSPEDYQAKKKLDSDDVLVLTPKESEAWKKLGEQKVHAVAMEDNVDHPSKYIIPKEATESLAAHKLRVAAFSSLMVGFEIVTLVQAYDNASEGEASLRDWANVVGGLFDTGDAVAACAEVFIERQQILQMLSGVEKTKPLSTIATASAVAAVTSVVANFYSAALCYMDYQERALSHSDSRHAYAMQGLGFTISGAGSLIFLLTGSVTMAIPILGVALIAIGTLAYYLWWTEDLPLLEMWLKHGPFSASDEGMLNYSGNDYQIRLYHVTIAEEGITTPKYYAFRIEDTGNFLMPISLYNEIGTNVDVLVLRNRDIIQEQTVWLEPNSYRLLSVDNPAPYTSNRANEGRGWLMLKKEQGEEVYYLDHARLGKLGDIVGQYQLSAGDDRALLEYLTPEKEIHPERFIQLDKDGSQIDKVDPKEWESDGKRCFEALKAALYPATVELQMWHKGIEDINKGHNPQHAYMNAVYGSSKIPTGNVAVVRLTLPHDIREDDVISVMLMRVDKGYVPIFDNDTYYVIREFDFQLSDISDAESSTTNSEVIISHGTNVVDRNKTSSNGENSSNSILGGVYLHDLGVIDIEQDGTTKARQVLAVIDLDFIDNLDSHGKQNKAYDIGNSITLEAWMSYQDSQSYNQNLINSMRPYRTIASHNHMNNRFIAWVEKATPFTSLSRISWYPSTYVDHMIVGPNLKPPLIKYLPGNPTYSTHI